MNVKNNKRRRESIEKIESALLTLLEKQELERISISKLCDLAGINRSTFYANFIDIFDLAEKMYEKIKQDFEAVFNVNETSKYTEDDFLRLLGYIAQNKEKYKIYFKLLRDDGCGEIFHKRNSLQSDANDPFLEYRIDFFRGGFNAIVKKWIDSGCAETPEQICSVLLNEYKGRF